MCSVLIFVKPDNNHDNPAEDWKKFKAGDVIDIHENDNLKWGDDIDGPNSLGWWKVVVVPNVPKALLASLTSSDVLPLVAIVPENPVEYPHRIRKFTVDLSQLKDEMTFDELLAAASMKPEMVNPAIIGQPNVIG